MEPNKLEQEFRDKLEQRTIEPSKMAWDRLDAMLSVNEEKEEKKVVAVKPNRNWMYMAASLVVFATIGAFFLTREPGNSNGTNSNSPSIVATEKPVQYDGTNDTIPSSTVQSATDNLSAPKMRQQAVAAVKAQKVPSGGRAIKQSPAEGYNVKENSSFIPPVSNENVAVVTKEGMKEDALKDFETEKFLIASAGNASKKKPSIKVDANSLLSSVEGELDESFRDKALQGVIKNFNAVKTSVANRNYQ